MSNSTNALAHARHSHRDGWEPLHILARSIAALLKRSWRTYWTHRARRAVALVLESLDERALEDIGLTRGEIRFAVFGDGADGRAEGQDLPISFEPAEARHWTNRLRQA